MKKIGSFFFTFIPFLLAIAFQYLAMFFVMGVALFYEHIRYIFLPAMSIQSFGTIL